MNMNNMMVNSNTLLKRIGERIISNSSLLLRPRSSLSSPQTLSKVNHHIIQYKQPHTNLNLNNKHHHNHSLPFQTKFSLLSLLPSQSIQAASFVSGPQFQFRKELTTKMTKKTKQAIVIDSKTGTEVLSKDRFPRNHARPGDPGRKYRSKHRHRMLQRTIQTRNTHKLRRENKPRRSPVGVNPKYLPKQKMPTPRLIIRPYVLPPTTPQQPQPQPQRQQEQQISV